MEGGIWLFHAYNKCLRTGCGKVLVWDHCLGHKSCEHQTIYALFGIYFFVVRQSFHSMQPTKGIGSIVAILEVIQGQTNPNFII